MLRNLKIVGVLAAFLALGATPAFAQKQVRVVMSTFGFAFLPVLVADAMGYFKEQDLAAELTKTGGDSKSMAALIGGGAEFSASSVSTVLRARASGTAAIAVGALLTQYASNLVVSRKWASQHGLTAKSTYEERLKALRGATLGITAPGSGTDHLVRFLAKAAGLDPERDLTITALGDGSTMTAALVQDRISGFTVSAPAAENAVKNHGAFMLFNFAQGEVKDLEGFLYIATGTRQSYAEKNPDTVVRFLRAQQAALNAIQDPKLTGAARDAVWKKYHSDIEKSFYDEVWAGTSPAYPKTMQITPEQIARIVAFANEFDQEKLGASGAAAGWTDKYSKLAASPN